jgi:3-dehydroquinate dehydratase/shikimate dehydrogenase
MPARSSWPRICIALGFSDPSKLHTHARDEINDGERFLELRLDFLPEPEAGLEVIRRLSAEFPDCFLMATCRRHQNHGHFNGSIEQQLNILDAAVDAGAGIIDIEVESAENAGPGLHRFDGRVKLVLSYHNFEGTPPLDPILRRMLRFPAAAYKVVTTAKRPTDPLRLFQLARSNPKTPLILLAMGEQGLITRILSPARGALYSYAAPNHHHGTAPGQLPAAPMRQQYRVEKLTRAARVYGVIADPVRHSISPAVHNRAMQVRRLDAVYLPFHVPTLQLKDFFLFATQLPLQGFSVTIPHKQKILRYLDSIDPLARRIGAVNTVWRKAGRWRGANTDAEGVRVPLAKHVKLNKASVLVAGNGGAARSAAFSLAAAGAKIFVTGRNPDRIRALAKVCGAEALTHEQAETGRFDVLVHATPLGMWPHTDECFFPGLIPASLVFELVYTPQQTLLMKRAAEQGIPSIPGLEMFLEQAAAQFEIFTGQSAPRSAMQQSALEALAAHEPHPAATRTTP